MQGRMQPAGPFSSHPFRDPRGSLPNRQAHRIIDVAILSQALEALCQTSLETGLHSTEIEFRRRKDKGNSKTNSVDRRREGGSTNSGSSNKKREINRHASNKNVLTSNKLVVTSSNTVSLSLTASSAPSTSPPCLTTKTSSTCLRALTTSTPTSLE